MRDDAVLRRALPLDRGLGPAELKQAMISAWQELSQSFIDRSINEWRRRLECVVHHNGGHIEHLFK